MSAGVAFLQPPCQDLINGRTGNDPELSESRYSPCEPPTGHAGTHTALDDDWMFALYISNCSMARHLHFDWTATFYGVVLHYLGQDANANHSRKSEAVRNVFESGFPVLLVQ
jgi:hypothetical protein